ncbi:MAG: PIN domain-containing protein [Deltaproteobacteria bacterium]|nr:PIN domain-containing protein [Deltaproteobacteria bacterium]
MVLVDTSVWIALFRQKDATLGKKMLSLIAANEAALCGQIWIEYLGGFRNEGMRKFHENALTAFPFLETTKEAFHLAADLLADHPRLGAGDAIIAATAISNEASLLSLDRDFHSLTRIGLRLF